MGGGDEAVVVWMGVMEAARGYINVRSFDTIFFFFIFESPGQGFCRFDNPG